MNADPNPAKALFLEAVEKHDPDQWPAFLDRACADQPDLRRRVEGLLAAHRQVGTAGLPSPVGGEVSGVSGIATLDEPPLRERPGTVIGPYRLMEQIGEGGMGLVFVAEQQHPVRRKVALKVIKPGMDTRQVVARFEAERQALALMDHPNIAKVLDGGETAGGRPYFVMELVKGVPITQFCDDNRLSPRERLELFVPVCEAVQHAHQKGIIHRDIKPSNVLVASHDGKPVVRVIDFGVAKAVGHQLTDRTVYTQFAQLIGTPLYMSPEQAGQSSLDVDTRSDIYALGVLLYELLTGTTPFDQERLHTVEYDEMRRIIREEEPARPSTRISTLGPAAATVSANRRSDPQKLRRLVCGELDWIVMKALEKDRDRRYETASAFAADVHRYLADEPVQACPPSAWYRLRKFFWRHKAGLGVVGLVLFFVVLMGSGAGWAVRDRAARETDLAREKAARQAKLGLEIEYALDEATRAREQALTLTDNPLRWEAALAEAASDLKRADGLAAQDEAALEPASRERLQGVHAQLGADEADRRFAARFEEVRLEQAEANVGIREVEKGIALTGLKDAFQRHYQIEFGATPLEQTVSIIQQRPRAMQDVLLAALEASLDDLPRDDPQVKPWLGAVLDAADTAPWRKRAMRALEASDWKALEQVIDEAVTARQPASLLLRLAQKIPRDCPICLDVGRRICQTHPGDFWANYDLANSLQYRQAPRLEEAIRYHGAALALRPGNAAACVNLANALRARGDLDGTIEAYRAALDMHPNYPLAHHLRSVELERKGDLEGAISAQRQAARLWKDWPEPHYRLGYLYADNGKWDLAASEYAVAFDKEPASNPFMWFEYACLDLQVGDAAGYRKLCERMRERFGGSKDPGEIVPLAHACVLAPGGAVDGAAALRLAEQRLAVTAPPSGHYTWSTHVMGLAHYRADQHQQAIACLNGCLEKGPDWQFRVLNWLVLAMAHHRLGQRDQAQRWFTQAQQWIQEETRTETRKGGGPIPAGWSWRDWLMVQLFRHEAEELIKKGSQARNQ
jgi:serine/threonine protein kinase/tetratricopeptide (TPR) repeat protein